MNEKQILDLIKSREELVREVRDLRYFKSKEAEGGCGVIGAICSEKIEGKYLIEPLQQMRNRGNGKGGGIAAVGLDASQVGVSKDVLEECYLIQLAFLDVSVREEIERSFLKSFHIFSSYKVEDKNSNGSRNSSMERPKVWRYFVRVKQKTLKEFEDSKPSFKSLEEKVLEDEFVYQNSFKLNKTFYFSYLIKNEQPKAFVLSHGKNLVVFKIVGYGDDVIKHYNLEDMKAHVWIGHHRYPTKGNVWHPGGAHPFVGLHEALVHNGDFANYYSISEYLLQKNIPTLFLTDTEVAVLLFDFWRRTCDYSLEYVIESLAPTTGRDFLMLPRKKQEVYRTLQKINIHASPDGPWFFIIARNDIKDKSYQLIGITDTSMLRPQVFSLQEGKNTIGIIASERQAINSMLRSLRNDGKASSCFADLYWSARGGSYTDGGAFIYSLPYDSTKLICTNKFGEKIEVKS